MSETPTPSNDREMLDFMDETEIQLARNDKLEESCESLILKLHDAKARITVLISERDRWKAKAMAKWAMRQELEEILGVDSKQPGDEQFKTGLAALREIIKERDKSLDRCDAAMRLIEITRRERDASRDIGWKAAMQAVFDRLPMPQFESDPMTPNEVSKLIEFIRCEMKGQQ